MARNPKTDRPESEATQAPPHYHGHRERLRARFRDGGSDALADYELLELVLFRAQPRRDMKPLAKSLIEKFGSFAEVIAASPQRLAEVEGVGEETITDFKVIEAAARRLAHGEVKRRAVLSSWSAVLDYCRAAMAFADKEQSLITNMLVQRWSLSYHIATSKARIRAPSPDTASSRAHGPAERTGPRSSPRIAAKGRE
jgi:hypothetical protein